MKARAALMLIVLWLGMSPGVAVGDSPKERPIPWTKVMVLHSNGNGVTELRLSRDVEIAHEAFGIHPNIKFDTQATFVGLVLVRVGEGPRTSIFAARQRTCSTPECDPSSHAWHFMQSAGAKHRRGGLVLPQGVYRAFLMTSGDEATVRIMVKTLGGQHRTIKMSRHDGAEILMSEPGTHPYLFEGATRQQTSRGLAYLSTWTKSDFVADDRGACLYRETPPLAEPLAYSPLCGHFGATQVDLRTVGPPTSPVLLGYTELNLGPGDRSHGVYAATAGAPAEGGALLAWLDYE